MYCSLFYIMFQLPTQSRNNHCPLFPLFWVSYYYTVYDKLIVFLEMHRNDNLGCCWIRVFFIKPFICVTLTRICFLTNMFHTLTYIRIHTHKTNTQIHPHPQIRIPKHLHTLYQHPPPPPPISTHPFTLPHTHTHACRHTQEEGKR